MKLVIN